MLNWEEFKFQIRRYFECRDSYSTILARVSNRIWKSHTERFVDYAEDKLHLMQSLGLTEKAQIDMLAGGVRNPSLIRHVLDIWVNTIPNFINHVRRITEDTVLHKQSIGQSFKDRRLSADPYHIPHGTKTCFTCNRTGYLAKDCRLMKPTCFKCRIPGHLSTYSMSEKTSEPGQRSELRDAEENFGGTTVFGHYK